MKDENLHTLELITAAAKNLGEGVPPMHDNEPQPLHMLISYKDDHMQKRLIEALGRSTISTMISQEKGKPKFSVVVTRTFEVSEDEFAIETTQGV